VAISKALEAQILRCHFVEHWGVNTIAAQLGVHHSTVDRVLSQAGLPKAERDPRPSIIDPYVPFIVETLAQFPKLSAARLYAMCQARGFNGGPSQFRARIAQLRPRKPAEAYLRLRTLPGEQAQVDWGHFGTVPIGRAQRALMAFVMVLSWSRQIYLRFFLNARMHSFLCGHVGAFEAWGALPRVVLYDNLKSAVLERHGQAIRFHPTLLELAAHYRFEPRPVAIARGNEKGRVERAIRYIREAFFAGRRFTDIDDLNAQADAWCTGPAAQRRCPQDTAMSVAQAFERERPRLLALPDNPFVTDERVEAKVGKTPYVRFDLNDYSVPHTVVRRTVTVVASLTRVRIVDGGDVIAEHRRVFGKGEQAENPAHIQALVQAKRAARHHRALDRLGAAVPASVPFIEQAVSSEATLRSTVRELERLLDDYGARELELALAEVMQRGPCHPNGVRQVLQRRRDERQLPSPLTLSLPDNDKTRNIHVRSPSLEVYDQLHNSEDADHDERS
jgi:transposase